MRQLISIQKTGHAHYEESIYSISADWLIMNLADCHSITATAPRLILRARKLRHDAGFKIPQSSGWADCRLPPAQVQRANFNNLRLGKIKAKCRRAFFLAAATIIMIIEKDISIAGA